MDIKLSNVDFSYKKNQVPIIRNLTLTIKKGDVVGIKGASGSGKTTLFRLLLGFESPDSGSIHFSGKPLKVKQLKKFRENTTWLPQDLDLGEGKLKEVFYYPFTFSANKTIKPEEERVLATFQSLGLDETHWNDSFSSLSTGQRQRVGLALCYLLDKDVLLLDEPTSALDEASKEKVHKLFSNKQRTIISTSHDPWWLEKCSKIFELNTT